MTFAPGLFENRVVVVTGGASGIGLEISRAFGALGARLVLASRKEDVLAQAVESMEMAGVSALGVPTDVKDPVSVMALADKVREAHGGLDILVGSHGANFLCPTMAMSSNGWKAVLDVVLTGSFHVCRFLAPLMFTQGGGRIIHIASTNAHQGSPLMAHSGAGKAGLLSLTESLAVELGPSGITVNTVSPGPVSTTAANARLWPQQEMMERIARTVPLEQRLATAQDVVGAVLFLASPAASFITGADIVIDGGNRLRQFLSVTG